MDIRQFLVSIPTQTLHDEIDTAIFTQNKKNLIHLMNRYFIAYDKLKRTEQDNELRWLYSILRHLEDSNNKEELENFRKHLIAKQIFPYADINRQKIIAIAENDLTSLTNIETMEKTIGEPISIEDLNLAAVLADIVTKGPSSCPFTNISTAIPTLLDNGVKPTSDALREALQLPSLPFAGQLLKAGASTIRLELKTPYKDSQLADSMVANKTAAAFYIAGTTVLHTFYQFKLAPFLHALEKPTLSNDAYKLILDLTTKHYVLKYIPQLYVEELRNKLHDIISLQIAHENIAVNSQQLASLSTMYTKLLSELLNPRLFDIIASEDLNRVYEFLLTKQKKEHSLTKEHFTSVGFKLLTQQHLAQFETVEMPELCKLDMKQSVNTPQKLLPLAKPNAAKALTLKSTETPLKTTFQNNNLSSKWSHLITLDDNRVAFADKNTNKLEIWNFSNNHYKVEMTLELPSEIKSLAQHPKTGHLYIALLQEIIILDTYKLTIIDSLTTKNLIDSYISPGTLRTTLSQKHRNEELAFTDEGLLFSQCGHSLLLINPTTREVICGATVEGLISGKHPLPAPYVITFDQIPRDRLPLYNDYITIIWNRHTKQAIHAFQCGLLAEQRDSYLYTRDTCVLPNGNVLFNDRRSTRTKAIKEYSLSINNPFVACIKGSYSHTEEITHQIDISMSLQLLLSKGRYALFSTDKSVIVDLQKGRTYPVDGENYTNSVQLTDGRLIMLGDRQIHLLQQKYISHLLTPPKVTMIKSTDSGHGLFDNQLQRPSHSTTPCAIPLALVHLKKTN